MPDTHNSPPADDISLGIASEYDAFISYKHGPIDSAAAKALQKNLEHFHVPILAGHAKGGGRGKRIRRVFLDEGELSATAAFASRIRLALKNSHWLIIICSPATKSSPWVDLEIKTFLEFHDRDHILAVMTSGEPADIFPEAFAGSGNLPDEMLAADARGVTAHDVERKLRGDTLLRIAAPILGMTYDDLKQRHRVYRLQRFLLAASLCIVAVTGFLIYASLQNRKLSQSNRDLRLRQSELITSEASEQLASGNNLEAIRGLLHVVTQLSGDGSSQGSLFSSGSSEADILPSSQYELTNALNLYVPSFTPNLGEEHIAPCAVLQSRDTLEPDLLSDSGGTHLLATDGRWVYVWDTANDRLCSEFCFDDYDYIRNWSAGALTGGGQIVLCGEHNVICYNYLTGKVSWKTAVLDNIRAVVRSGAGLPDSSAGNGSSPASEDSFYVLSDTGLTILDAASGTLLSEYRFRTGRNDTLMTSYSFNSEGDDAVNPFGTIEDAFLSRSGKYLLFSSRDPEENASLYAHDLESGKTVQVDTAPYLSGCYKAASYYGGPDQNAEYFLFSRLQKSGTGYTSALASVTLEYQDSALSVNKEWEKSFPLDGQASYSGNTGAQTGSYNRDIHFGPDLQTENQPSSFVYACGRRLLLIDPQSGQILNESSLPYKIIEFQKKEGQCRISTVSGKIYDYNGEALQLFTSAFRDNCSDIEKISGQTTYYCLSGSSITRYSPNEPDLGYVKLTTGNERVPAGVLSQDENWTVLYDWERLCWISEKEDTLQTALYTDLIRSASGKELSGGSAPSDSSGGLNPADIYLLCAEDGVVRFISASDDGLNTLVISHYQLSLADQSVTKEDLFKINSGLVMDEDCLYDARSNTLYVMNSQEEATVIWSYSFDTGKAVRHTLPLGLKCGFCRMSPAGDKILLASEMDFMMLDLDSWQIEYTISNTNYTSSAIMKLRNSDGRDRICWDGHNLVVPDVLKLHVYDSTGKETHTINCDRSSAGDVSDTLPCAALSPGGTCLYYTYGSAFVQYSLTDDKILNETELPSAADDLLYTNSSSWVYYFNERDDRSLRRFRTAIPSPAAGQNAQEPDTMRILYRNNFYCIRCDTEAFGVMTWVSGASAYNPQSGKIYLLNRLTGSGTYDNIYYREYSLADLIRIAQERYGSGL